MWESYGFALGSVWIPAPERKGVGYPGTVRPCPRRTLPDLQRNGKTILDDRRRSFRNRLFYVNFEETPIVKAEAYNYGSYGSAA